MKNFAIDILDRISSADNDEERWEITNEMVAKLGGSAVNFGLIDLGTMNPLWMRSSMSPEWLEEYMINRYFSDDPCLNHLKNSNNTTNIMAGSVTVSNACSKTAYDLNWGLKDAGYSAFHFVPLAAENKGAARAFTFCVSDDLKDTFEKENLKKVQLVAALASAYMSAPAIDHPNTIAEVSLTPRETQTLSLLAQGNKNVEIAHQMNVAEITVRKHLISIRRKLGAKTREQAISIAVRAGLLNF